VGSLTVELSSKAGSALGAFIEGGLSIVPFSRCSETFRISASSAVGASAASGTAVLGSAAGFFDHELAIIAADVNCHEDAHSSTLAIQMRVKGCSFILTS
jgi:hypothetical protein